MDWALQVIERIPKIEQLRNSFLEGLDDFWGFEISLDFAVNRRFRKTQISVFLNHSIYIFLDASVISCNAKLPQ